MAEKNEIMSTNNEEIITNVPELTVEEAKELTQSIQSTAMATCVLLQRAHDGKAWAALGYNSWKEYIEKEFKFSRARSYQLLSQGAIIKTISDAAGTDVYLTEQEAKTIKKELPKITKKLKAETKDLNEDDRKDKVKAIVNEELQHARATDKDNYDEGKDIDNMIAEDSDKSEESRSTNVHSAQEESPKPAKSTPEANAEADIANSNYYFENLGRTLSIVEAFPKADDMVLALELSEKERIEIRNRVKYAISWLETLNRQL